MKPQLDDGLHEYWVAKSNDRFIIDFFDRHGPYYWAVGRYYWEMLEYADDFRLAKRALSKHIRGQRETLVKTIAHLRVRKGQPA